MKDLIKVTILFCCQFAFSQEELIPPNLDLEGIDVNWVYLLEDTNFVGNGSSNATRYSGHFFKSLVKNDDHIFLLNQSIRGSLDFDGFDLYKLDAQSGTLMHSLNYDYYGESKHYYNFGDLSKVNFSEGKLEILGYQSIDTMLPPSEFSFPIWAFYGLPTKFELSLNNLSLIDKQVGLIEDNNGANLYNFISPKSDDLIQTIKDEYIHLSKEIIIEDGYVKSLINLYGIDIDFNIDTTKTNRITYNTQIQSNLPSLGIPTWYNVLNDSTLLTINFSKSLPDVSKSPETAILSIYDIKSIEEVDLERSVDISEYFYKGETIDDFYRFNIADHIILTQTSFDLEQSQTNLESHSWLVCFDYDGNLKYSLTDFGDNEFSYRYLTPLLLEENNLIFSATYNLPSETGFDLFKVNINSNNQPIKIGKISQASNETFYFKKLLLPLQISPENHVIPILGFYEFEESSSRTAKMHYLISVNLKDQILDSTEDVFNANSIKFTVYPNPAIDKLMIEFNELFSGEISIHTSSGVLVIKKLINQELISTVDLSSIEVGNYIFKVKDDVGRIIKSSVLFKS